MSEPRHGTRACYKHGCTRVECRAAEARYRQQLRADLKAGKYRLSSKVSAQQAWQTIRRLRAEATLGEIAQRGLGLKRPILEWHHTRITMRNHLKMQRLGRLWLSDGPDAA